MKAAVCKPVHATQAHIPYPNAADRKYFLNKAVDLMLIIACGAGMAAVLLFLLTIA